MSWQQKYSEQTKAKKGPETAEIDKELPEGIEFMETRTGISIEGRAMEESCWLFIREIKRNEESM